MQNNSGGGNSGATNSGGGGGSTGTSTNPAGNGSVSQQQHSQQQQQQQQQDQMTTMTTSSSNPDGTGPSPGSALSSSTSVPSAKTTSSNTAEGAGTTTAGGKGTGTALDSTTSKEQGHPTPPPPSSSGDKDEKQKTEKKNSNTTKDRNANTLSDLTDAAVLEYLKKRGLGSAALELTRILEEEKKEKVSAKIDEKDDDEKSATAKKKSETTTTQKQKGKNDERTLGTKGDGDGDDDDDGGGGKYQETHHSQTEDEDTKLMELDEARARNQRTALALSTGGGLGYDLDAAPAVVMWGTNGMSSRSGGAGTQSQRKQQQEKTGDKKEEEETADDADDDEGGHHKAKRRRKNHEIAKKKEKEVEDRAPLSDENRRGQEEARNYVHSFTKLQTWVLSLPDDPAVVEMHSGRIGSSSDSVERGHGDKGEDQEGAKDADKDKDEKGEDKTKDKNAGSEEGASLTSVLRAAAAVSGTDMSKLIHVIPLGSTITGTKNSPQMTVSGGTSQSQHLVLPHVPPSAKAELQSVTFPLLVHTYCELLECGLESTAQALLATYRHVHEPLYTLELSDLDRCQTTNDIAELNTNVLANTEAVAEVRTIKNQIMSLRKKKMELISEGQQEQQQQQGGGGGGGGNALPTNTATTGSPVTIALRQRKISEYDDQLVQFEAKYREVARRASACASKLQCWPFLRRARALRWQINLSVTSYGLLAAYLSREGLLPMSALLQSRCHINVERRDPLPFTPPCILEDMVLLDDRGEEMKKRTRMEEETHKAGETTDMMVKWAAPVHPYSRLAEAGEDVTPQALRSILNQREKLPFPKFYLDKEYETAEEADLAKRNVEFNRALLVNGFRRLEALELKREYEVGMRHSANISGCGAANDMARGGGIDFADPLSPSVLLSTLCSSSSSSTSGDAGSGGAAIVPTPRSGGTAAGPATAASCALEESGIGITCAKLCPPDGRKVAAGCDDAAVRIWSLHNESSGTSGKGSVDSASAFVVGEASLVLLGHKNGFPVFDLDWNRDGRTLLSAGGDGAVRLWDTMAVGPFGRLANITRRTTNPSGSTSTTLTSLSGGPNSSSINSSSGGTNNISVPGMRSEPLVEVNGAALASYRGHAPSTPLWSVAFAPSGYYFASAGSDSTARIWTTDRPTPVRVLAGHISPSVNCVTWHPNCNYLLTGSDDKTVRMWDIQTGKCVRLMSGCCAGVNVLRVSPSGRYVAAADYSGIVNIWDIGSGRKVNELRPPRGPANATGDRAKKSKTTGNVAKGASSASSLVTSGGPMIHAISFSACGTALATGGDDCTVRIWDVRGVGSHMSNPDYAATRGWGDDWPIPVTSYTGGVFNTQQAGHRMPIGEKHRPGMREPVNSFRTRRTIILDMKYTKRNLLLSVGKYAASAGQSSAPVAD